MNERRRLPWFGILLTLLEIGVGYGVFRAAEAAGATPAVAYASSSVGPVLGFVVFWIKDRRVSGMSLAMLAFTVLSAAVAFVGRTDEKWLIYKDSLVTGGIGAIFALSVLARRPLCYYFAQRFATDGSQEAVDAFDDNWQYLEFRRIFQWCSVWMGVVYVVEAAVRIVLANVLSFDASVLVSKFLPVVATAVAAGGMILISRHYGRLARARGWDGTNNLERDGSVSRTATDDASAP